MALGAINFDYLDFQLQLLLRFLYFDSYFQFAISGMQNPRLTGFLGLFTKANFRR